MTTDHPSTSSVGRWRTCCIPCDLFIQSRWTGLAIGLVCATVFVVICFFMSAVWLDLLVNNCDVLQGNNSARCSFSLVYIIGVPLVLGVYFLFLPVLLYRIGRQNEEQKGNQDLEDSPESPHRNVE